MHKAKLLKSFLIIASFIVSTLVIGESIIEEVITTGSYLNSQTDESNQTLTVIDRDFIDKINAQNVNDIVKNITFSSGAENQTDAFTQGSTQGTSNINLRGLGLSSTLILIDGKRQTISGALANDGSVFVDTSTIPIIALERIEILREGASSIYGSDAVAGVVNFILKDDYDGFEFDVNLAGTYEHNQKDGSISFIYGSNSESTNYILAGSYQDRSPLNASSKMYLSDNAVSSLGSSFIALAPAEVSEGSYQGTYAAGQYIPNAKCSEYEEAVPIGVSLCGFWYGPRFNLVNDEEKKQLFGSFRHALTNNIDVNADITFNNNKVLDNPQSPSYPDLTFPVISADHPSNPLKVPLAWLGRPFAFDYASPKAPRHNTTYRYSFGLEGNIGSESDWKTSITHSTNEYRAIQPDTIASRLQDAFNGIGGPNGNEYYDPFIPDNNSQALYDYLSYETNTVRETSLTVLDGIFRSNFVLSNSISTQFALGIQAKKETYATETDDLYEIRFDPDGTPIPVDLIFLGGVSEIDESRNTFSIFAETKMQLTDTLNISSALRYEDLDVGKSIDPKIALFWQMNEKFSSKVTWSTAFREASLSQMNAQIVQLEGIQDYNEDGSAKGGVSFVRVTQSGSQDLDPEESRNIGIGLTFKPYESALVDLDYWSIDYDDLITVENAQGKILADINGADIYRTDNGTLSGIKVQYFNSSEVKVSGLDMEGSFNITDEISFSILTSQLLNFEITSPTGEKIDALGKFNRGNFARSLPKNKTNLNIDWSKNNLSMNGNINFISSYSNGEEKVNSYETLDLNFRVRLSKINESQSTIGVGVRNLFNEQPPRVNDAANLSYDPKQHDPLGRVIYVNFNYQF